MKEVTLKICKTGHKFIIYLPKNFRENLPYKKGALVKIILRNKYSSSSLITKFNHIMTIKKAVVNKLKIKDCLEIKIQIESFSQAKKSKDLFYGDKIDLLFFLPEKTRKGSEVYSEEVIIGKEFFIRLISIHSRGSSRPILLKRFIDPRVFGKLLGQIQAEGTKTNLDILEFCNKNLLELRDFIYFLSEIGIPKDNLFVKLDYHVYFENKLQKIVEEFKDFLGLEVNYLSSSNRKAKGYGFKIILRNTVVSELILNSLKLMRDNIENSKWDNNITAFSEGYISKVLCGDGTFEITSKERRRVQSRIKIYDGNLKHLSHYSIVLRKFGFSPYVNEKYIFVKAMCNTKLANKLLEIGAFDTNDNKQRINLFIKNNEATTKRK